MVPLLFSGLLLALLPRPSLPAPGERPTVEFRWDAPVNCPPESKVIAELERLLGPLAQRRGERLSVIARVRQEPKGKFDLRLWTIRDEGMQQRSLQHASCEMLAKVGAVIAAMVIDPAEVARRTRGSAAAEIAAGAQPVEDAEPPPPLLTTPRSHPAPPRSQPVTPRSQPAPAPPAPTTTLPRKRRTARGGVRVSGGISAGDLPGFGAAFRVTPALLWQRLRVELEANYEPPRSILNEGVIGKLQLASGAVRAGPVLRAGRFEFPLCVGAEFGAIVGTAMTDTVEVKGKQARALLVAVHLAPSMLFVPHPRVAVGVTVEGAAALVRPQFDINGVLIYRTSPVSLRALAGVEIRFR